MAELLVSVVGSANQDMVAQVDVLPRPGQTVLGRDLIISPGGKGLNQAVAAARASAPTAFIGLVGRDNAGVHLRDVLIEEGIDIRGLGQATALTGRALISVARGGGNHIVVVPGANWAITPAHVDRHREQVRASATLLCQLEIPTETVAHALRLARASGTRTVLNAAPTTTLDRSLLELVDVLVVNEHEAAMLAAAVAPGSATPRRPSRHRTRRSRSAGRCWRPAAAPSSSPSVPRARCWSTGRARITNPAST